MSELVELSDAELLRYSRQIMLPSFDIEGQLALKGSRALIIGLGGLGSPVSMYLASAGLGHLVLVDDDEVDLSNLQRQIAHTVSAVGEPKVESAKLRLEALNPDIRVETFAMRLEGDALAEQVEAADVVIDCSDNFTTRFTLNRLCVEKRVPLVSGAAIRMEGQISVFDFRREDSPCYQCLYGESEDENLNCSESGVMAPLVGVIGSMQALEAIKVLAGLGDSLSGRLLVFDAMSADWRSLKLKKDRACACCGSYSTT